MSNDTNAIAASAISPGDIIIKSGSELTYLILKKENHGLYFTIQYLVVFPNEIFRINEISNYRDEAFCYSGILIKVSKTNEHS